MFSVAQKRAIAEAVQRVLRETNHPELPAGEIAFTLHVDGAESWSWADIRNNGAVSHPGVNPWNELAAALDAQRPETAGTMPMPEIRVGDTIVHGRPREPLQFMYRVTEYERKAWQDDPNVVAVLAPLWRREGNQS